MAVRRCFYTFVLAELFPRQHFWMCFLSSHSSYTPACSAGTVSQTKCSTFVISVDGGDRLWFWICVKESRSWKTCNFAITHESSRYYYPPSLGGSSLILLTSAGCLTCHPIMGCTAVQGQRKSQHFRRVINRLCVSYLAKPGSTSIRTSGIAALLFLFLPHICSPCYYRNWTYCWENDS